MQDKSKSEIVIRNMENSDVPFIVLSEKEQRKDCDVEKFYNRLEEQSKGQNYALVAECNGEIAGYVYVYPFSKSGLFKGEGFSEIVDLNVLKKNKNLGVEDKLMDAAEKIASDYSDIVYLSVKIHDWKTLNRCVKQDFIVHKSGVWKENNACSDCENGDELVFWLYKNLDKAHIHRFLVSNTIERPLLRWYQEGVKKILGNMNIEKCQRIKVGDEILLTDKQNRAYVKGIVTFKHEYDTIRDMVKSEGVKNLLPFLNDDDIEEGVNFYQNIPEFHCVDEYGCVAFGLRITESKL